MKFRFSPFLLFFAAVVLQAAPDHTRVTILGTTDMHAHIMPENLPFPHGLAKAATLIKAARKEDPELLLVDSGDTIQGTPLAYYHNRTNNLPPDPMMLAMTALSYDAMAVGNHEYNFGLDVLQKARREGDFPWLSANTYRSNTNETAYAPYVIKQAHGVKVGILGLTTPGVPYWEEPKNYAGLELREPVSEAKKWVRILRNQEHVDLVVIAMHMGLEYDPVTGRAPPAQVPNENTAIAIAEQVPGIDVILMGHTHRDVSNLVVNGVLLVQAEKWAQRIAQAEVFLHRNEAGAWRVVAKTSTTIPVTIQTPSDPDILKIGEPYHRETEAWLNKPIGECSAWLNAGDSRLRDNAILDLIHKVQLEAGQADVSMAASFNLDARIPQGPITVRDVYSLYVYENTLVVIEVTGAQLKAALEHSARYFLPYQPGKTIEQLIDPMIPGYNFDTAEGVNYTIDLTQPAGARITDLTFQGQPLKPDQKLRLAINSYRLNGGGGYSMYKDAPVLNHSSSEIRNLIIDWIEQHHQVPAEPTNNWKIKSAP